MIRIQRHWLGCQSPAVCINELRSGVCGMFNDSNRLAMDGKAGFRKDQGKKQFKRPREQGQHGGSASPRPPSDGASPAAFVKKQKTDRNSNGGKPPATSPGQNKKPFQAGPPKDKDRKPQFSPKEQAPRQHERPQQQQKQPPRQQDRQPPRQQDRQQQHHKRQEGVSHKPAHLPSSQPQKPTKGRHYTVSVAVATSILNNVQSMELRTYVVGEIARALAIFHVDEVVLYGDPSVKGGRGNWDPTHFFARLLQYVETPQYLRKALFPHHADLRFAGLLNPLDAPHHPRLHERLTYREGVTIERPPEAGGNGNGTPVDIGLRREVMIDYTLKPGVRVTLKLPPNDDQPKRAEPVSPAAPREEKGLYWGYTTRVAPGLKEALEQCPFEGGYDLTIGTSERGHASIDDDGFELKPFRHLLIVIGGVAGLEATVKASTDLGVSEAKTHSLFDVWLNVCPDQGSRTIRTEEAILITLARLRPLIRASGMPDKPAA